MSKLTKMQRFLPQLYAPNTNEMVRGLLYAWSGEDDNIVTQIQNAKEMLFVATSQLQYLDALGSNVGVYRPTAFHLADEQFQQLIPALSFYPKQVKPTIIKVLGAFFGQNNPLVKIYEVSPNQITIQIPSSVPSLRRSLEGSLHFKPYRCVINTVDNIHKTLTVTWYAGYAPVADQFANCSLGQNLTTEVIQGDSGGNVDTLQFAAGVDLSGYVTGTNAVLMNPNYPGAYIPDTTRPYTVTMKRGVLGQAIVKGNIAPTLHMTDSSNIPNSTGLVTFNFGYPNEEGPIQYFGRPNNTTLLLDPSYNFQQNHSIGEVVNVVVTPYRVPRTSGLDYSVYIVGVTAARILAQQIVESVLAAGIVVNWIVVNPVC